MSNHMHSAIAPTSSSARGQTVRTQGISSGEPELPQQDPPPQRPNDPIDPGRPQQPELPPIDPHTPTVPEPHIRG